MITKQDIASFLLRLALGLTFLSAVAGRLGLWQNASGWDDFLKYTASVNSFAPKSTVPLLAITATIIETVLGLLLVIGYKTKWIALGASLLTLTFALTMSYSFGLKSAFDYSVFVDSSAAFLLACFPKYKWSLDNFRKD